MSQQPDVDKREKVQALSLAKECYSMKLELLTNATVVDDAIMFVSQKSIGKLESQDNTNKEGKIESREPDCHEDKEEEVREMMPTNEDIPASRINL